MQSDPRFAFDHWKCVQLNNLLPEPYSYITGMKLYMALKMKMPQAKFVRTKMGMNIFNTSWAKDFSQFWMVTNGM